MNFIGHNEIVSGFEEKVERGEMVQPFCVQRESKGYLRVCTLFVTT